jgi:hypothetical protein
MAEAGSASVVVERAWITYGSTWGDSLFTITTLAPDGRVIRQWRDVVVPNNTKGFVDVPDGCAMATIEGTTQHADTLPAAALVCKAR